MSYHSSDETQENQYHNIPLQSIHKIYLSTTTYQSKYVWKFIKYEM
jgi:hypothetical protein